MRLVAPGAGEIRVEQDAFETELLHAAVQFRRGGLFVLQRQRAEPAEALGMFAMTPASES
jgi:hypothetical protein